MNNGELGKGNSEMNINSNQIEWFKERKMYIYGGAALLLMYSSKLRLLGAFCIGYNVGFNSEKYKAKIRESISKFKLI